LGTELEMTLTCRQCGKQFIFSQSEHEFYQQKGFTLPKHCKECRSTRRTQTPLVCSKCGKKVDTVSDLCCLSCVENMRLEFELEAKKSKETLEAVGAKLSAAEAEKVQLVDTMNANFATIESEKVQLVNEAEAKISTLENEKIKLLQEAENRLSTIASEKASLASLLEQEIQTAADMKEKFSKACSELEKAIKYRATLDYLEPALSDIRTNLEVLGRTQEGINQKILQLTRENSETLQNSSPLKGFKRILRIGRKSASPLN
jgi:hypothetical protein